MHKDVEILDEKTLAIYLELPGSKIVLLQAYFEIHESVAVVRTISVKDSLVCVICTTSTVEVCFEILNSIQDQLHWRIVPKPDSFNIEKVI